MGKLLFWIAVIVVAMFAIRLMNQKKARDRQQPEPKEKPSINQAEEMVRCSHCSVYMPRSEALLKEGHFWCSPEHAQFGAKKR